MCEFIKKSAFKSGTKVLIYMYVSMLHVSGMRNRVWVPFIYIENKLHVSDLTLLLNNILYHIYYSQNEM